MQSDPSRIQEVEKPWRWLNHLPSLNLKLCSCLLPIPVGPPPQDHIGYLLDPWSRCLLSSSGNWSFIPRALKASQERTAPIPRRSKRASRSSQSSPQWRPIGQMRGFLLLLVKRRESTAKTSSSERQRMAKALMGSLGTSTAWSAAL